jgi:hypothetical protein
VADAARSCCMLAGGVASWLSPVLVAARGCCKGALLVVRVASESRELLLVAWLLA